MKVWLLIFYMLSVNSYAETVSFKNCEPNLCEVLLAQISDGIPQFVEQINTGKALKIAHEKIESIEQIGNIFKVWSYGSGYYHINYKCFDGVPCMFIWRGTRTVH